jgi:quinol monooxygenase YgiN
MRGDGSTPAHFLTITVRPGPQRCRYREQVLGIIRLRLDHGAADDESVQTSMQELVGILQQQPGVIRVALGRAVDDPTLWSLVSEWADLGSYRRALSGYAVKVAFGPIQRWILDEPSVFQTVTIGDRADTLGT